MGAIPFTLPEAGLHDPCSILHRDGLIIQCAGGGVDHLGYVLRLYDLELTDRIGGSPRCANCTSSGGSRKNLAGISLDPFCHMRGVESGYFSIPII